MKTVALLVVSLLLSILNVKAQANTKPAYSFGVRITGRGKPMLLIPGFKGSADTYNQVVGHYKGRYKCYVVTLAGFAGQPPSLVHDHLLLKQRDDIIRYIVNEHLNKPVMVGFSFGGTLALWITTTRPDLVGALIDLDGTPFDAALGNPNFKKDSLLKADSARYKKFVDETPAYWARRDSIFHSPESIKKGDVYMAKLVTDTNRSAETLVWDKASDFRSGALMDLEADTIDMRGSVARVTSPILVLGSWVSWDYKSKADGENDYKKMYAQAKNVTMVFSEKGRHFLMYDDLDWMLAQMDEFLKKFEDG